VAKESSRWGDEEDTPLVIDGCGGGGTSSGGKNKKQASW